jgi:hypothetical protein
LSKSGCQCTLAFTLFLARPERPHKAEQLGEPLRDRIASSCRPCADCCLCPCPDRPGPSSNHASRMPDALHSRESHPHGHSRVVESLFRSFPSPPGFPPISTYGSSVTIPYSPSRSFLSGALAGGCEVSGECFVIQKPCERVHHCHNRTTVAIVTCSWHRGRRAARGCRRRRRRMEAPTTHIVRTRSVRSGHSSPTGPILTPRQKDNPARARAPPALFPPVTQSVTPAAPSPTQFGARKNH